MHLEHCGSLQTVVVMIYCHFSVALLCINVLFDLFVFGIPAYVLNKLHILPNSIFFYITSLIINWTTPIVIGMPMVLSGSNIYLDNVDLFVKAKQTDSLVLANHGSRIDWMVGMFVGHMMNAKSKLSRQVRVGFVCEAVIQFMPIIGWYRKIVTDDVFVWRSFERDGPAITRNITRFHQAHAKRMLFLSPEGIVVDFGERDKEYIEGCRNFSLAQGRRPLDYVLTPRHKGTRTLLQQVHAGGPVISVCIAYVRDGKLLNCRLTSPDRVVPDIYLLNQGISGKPVHVYVNLELLNIDAQAQGTDINTKTLIMDDYDRKDRLLAEWAEEIKKGVHREDWNSRFQLVRGNKVEAILYQVAHGFVMVAISLICGHLVTLVNLFTALFLSVGSCHTIGWFMSSTSAESVPFETGIKAILMFLFSEKKERQ